MPAATTFVRRNVNKLMAVGPAHVTSAGTLKARRKGEQAPAAPDAALDASDVSPNAVLQAVRGLENHRQRTKKMPHRKDRKRRTASQAAHAGFARKVASLGVEESDGSEDEGDLGVSQPALDASAVGEEDVDTSPPVTLQILVKPAKVPKRKAEDFEVIPKVRAVIALDDPAPVLPEVDEPWEHIDFEDEHDQQQPSYAQVLAAAA